MASQRLRSNQDLAAVFERLARLLEAQRASAARVESFHQAARAVARHGPEAFAAGRQGAAVARERFGLGPEPAYHLTQFARRGGSGLLDRMEGRCSPEEAFAAVPAVGATLAGRIARHFPAETLADLVHLAHAGGLRVAGLGTRRVRAVLTSLEALVPQTRPAPETLLELDGAYREAARTRRLACIAPVTRNPYREAWLPVMHADRDGTSYFVRYSNSRLAGAGPGPSDAVVIWWQQGDAEGETVVWTAPDTAFRRQREVRTDLPHLPRQRPWTGTSPAATAGGLWSAVLARSTPRAATSAEPERDPSATRARVPTNLR